LRVRWVEVEVNGADTTIEEALRAVERMRRPAIDAPLAPKRIVNSAAAANGESAPPQDPSLFDKVEDVQPEGPSAEPGSDGADESTAAEALRKKRGDGRPQDRNAGIKLVGDIDFVPTGKQSLKDFFAEKAPASDMDQILVLCHFLQHILDAPQIGPGHILSGFKHVGKPIPKDLKQTVRNMKDKKAWLSFADIENIRLTTEGDNRVEHELGKGSSDDGAQ
jgi:hypothetical protein